MQAGQWQPSTQSFLPNLKNHYPPLVRMSFFKAAFTCILGGEFPVGIEPMGCGWATSSLTEVIASVQTCLTKKCLVSKSNQLYPTGRDHEAASRLSPSSRPETLLNGMELDHGPKSATHCFSAGPVSFISGNGTSHLVAPHGSVVGSNGFNTFLLINVINKCTNNSSIY